MPIDSPAIQKITNWVIPKMKPLLLILAINFILVIIISIENLVETYVNICLLEGGIFLVFGGIIFASRTPSTEESTKNNKEEEKKKSDILGINPPKININTGKIIIEMALLLIITGVLIDMFYRLFQ